ncbi:MAG: putative Ig domain-containing protein [Rhodocyclaceae bacterium]|nr:putative Ig domain-containing protein [Rhodocyclaceae bacterium]
MSGLLAILALPAWADADSARNKGMAWLIQQQRGDGSWANGGGDLGMQATSAALLALKNGGLSKSPTFGAASAWLANADADSIDSIARKIEALAAAGMPGSAQNEADRLYGLRSLSSSATWGGYGGSGVDYLDTALGLTALRLGDGAYGSKAAATSSNVLVGAFCDLGNSRVNVASGKQAWPTTQAATSQSAGQGRPSVVATALLLNELRGMQKAVSTGFSSATCGSTSYSFATLQTEAQTWLLDQQNSDGGFGEQRTDGSKGNSSVLVTALAYRALNTQTTPPQPQTGNAQSWLLAQQDSTSGSWRNDPLVTAQVISVLPAAAGTQLADTDHDGVTDLVEAQLGSNQNVADARNQIGAPTLAMPGVSATAFAVNATTGQAFAYSLGGGGTFTLISGSLPPGLSLTPATGQVSGTPTQAGSYSFDYQTTSGGNSQLVIGRIDVSDATSTETSIDGDVPLPAWALVLLGAALFGAGQRRRNAA